MIYYLLIAAILFSPVSSKAEEAPSCNLKELGFGKNFSEVNKKYNLTKEFRGNKKYTKNIRGRDICPAFGKAEVEMLFLNDELVQIIVFNKSEKTKIWDIALKNFGKPRNMPNENASTTTFTTMWDLGESVAVYSRFNRKGSPAERFMVQYKHAAHDIAQANSEEDTSENTDSGNGE